MSRPYEPGRRRHLAIGLLLLAGGGAAQWPGLPPRSGRQEPPAEGRRLPSPPAPLRAEPVRLLGPQGGLPLPEQGPGGAAPRTGSGLGLWEALVAMARDEGGPEAEALPAPAPDRALLVRYADEVFLRDQGEPAWELLPWWRKVHLVAAGTEVRLGPRGRVLLALHDGAVLDLKGPALLAVDRLDREAVELSLGDAGRLLLDGRERPLRATLPSGHTLEVVKGLVQVRQDPPRRFCVDNLGPGPALLHDREREIRLDWNQGCILPWFLGAPPPPPPAGPATGEPAETAGQGVRRLAWTRSLEIRLEESGASVTAAGRPGRVVWGGCVFDLPPGGRLRLVGPAGEAGGRPGE